MQDQTLSMKLSTVHPNIKLIELKFRLHKSIYIVKFGHPIWAACHTKSGDDDNSF